VKRFAVLLLSIVTIISMTLSGCERRHAVPKAPDITVAAVDFIPAERLDDPIIHTVVETVIDSSGNNADDNNGAADDPHEGFETASDSSVRSFINVYWATKELYRIVMRYKELHPDFPHEIRTKKSGILSDEYYLAFDK